VCACRPRRALFAVDLPRSTTGTFGFRLPEPVLDVPEAERASRTWGNDVLMQVQGVGAFVRILVPVHLTGGYTVTFGAWLGLHPDDLRRAHTV